MMIEFPLDSNGMALKKMAERGMDMSKPIVFEFYIHVENKQQANDIYMALKEQKIGDDAESVYDEGELEKGEEMTEENEEFWPSWTVYVYHKMVPDHSKLLQFQEELNRLSKPFGGWSDGWGVYQEGVQSSVSANIHRST
jgi:hypothetical protein